MVMNLLDDISIHLKPIFLGEPVKDLLHCHLLDRILLNK